MSTSTYIVTGMSCQHCVDAVTAEVARVPGVSGVEVDLSSGRLVVTTEDSSRQAVDDDAIRGAVDEAGYEVAG